VSTCLLFKFEQFVKILFRLVNVLLAASVLMACEKKEIIFEGPYHVRFTEAAASARESFNKPIQISVHLAGPQRNEPVTVRYTISGTARKGIDYRIEGEEGTVVIPARQSFGYITLRLINNANNILESQEVIFNIISVTPADLQIGFSKDGIIGRSTSFTILDDCILNGSYTGILEGFDDVAPVSEIAFTSADCQEYVAGNWNIGLIEFPSIAMDFRFIDNGDNTLTIPKQAEETLSAPNDTIQGTGSVNPLNGRLTFNIEVLIKDQAGKDSARILVPVTYIPE
jgi:hypothetical protein